MTNGTNITLETIMIMIMIIQAQVLIVIEVVLVINQHFLIYNVEAFIIRLELS